MSSADLDTHDSIAIAHVQQALKADLTLNSVRSVFALRHAGAVRTSGSASGIGL